MVQYLNTAPLVWGMLHGDERDRFDLSFTTPAHCAEDLKAARADIGIIPSIEYQRIDGLRVLPSVSIASKNRVRSVLLLSRVSLEAARSVALAAGSNSLAAQRSRPEIRPASRISSPARRPTVRCWLAIPLAIFITGAMPDSFRTIGG